MKHSSRILWVDLLKIISIFGVLIIHSAAPLLITYHKSSYDWWVGNLYDSLVRWCIPVFFMLSGMFVLDHVQRHSLRFFFRSRSVRIVIPFLFWSGLYFLWRIKVNGEPISVVKSLSLFFLEPAYYHLWFIYTLIGLYAISPVLGGYLKSASKKNKFAFVLLWFVFGSLVPTVESITNIKTYLSIETPGYIFYYAGYFMLGYILKDTNVRGWVLFALLLLFIAAFFSTAYGTYYMTVINNGGTFSDVFYNYYSVNVLLMSLCVYLIIKSITLPSFLANNHLLFSSVGLIAATIPGIYLIHAMVISFLKRGRLSNSLEMCDSAIGIPIFTLITFIISFCLIVVLKQLPFVKKIVP